MPGATTVFAPHNVEHRIAAGNARASRGLRHAFGELEWRKIAREEHRLWRSADLVLAVSELDADAMRAGGAHRVELCPNGTDRRPKLAPPRRATGEPLRLLFIGSGSYRPYEVGLKWFVTEVLPLVAEDLAVRLDVVGERPRHPVEAPGVCYRGRVASVTSYYEQAHALVVPVFEGSGTRLKVVEAMAYGRPVVATGLGAEGLPIEAGTHYLRADDARGFADRLVELARQLTDPTGVAEMLDAGRSAVTPLFWDTIVARLSDVYRSVLPAIGGAQ